MNDKTLPEMEAKNNKETINLLDLLSESESTVSDIVLTPKKKKVKRRYRSGGYSVKEKRPGSCGCGRSQTRALVLWLAAVLITLWLLALSWLAAILYSDIRRMDSNIRSVGAQDNTEGDSVVLLEMDSVAVTVPLRPPTKKMKKRKELDALAAPHVVTRRNSGKRSSQELLTDSSDERSEYWSVSTRGGRKCRGSRRNRSCHGFLRACSAFLACASVLATATLIWLFIDVRQQLTVLRTELDRVSIFSSRFIETNYVRQQLTVLQTELERVRAGNEGVPETLQKYHSISRDLQNNQTIIFANITEIQLQIGNFTSQLSSIQHGLHEVQETIRAAPELINVPNQLKELSTEVSRWGSRITDLVSTANESKEADAKIHNVIIKNITTLEQKLADLSNVTQQPQAVFSNESKAQIESMNSMINEVAKNLTKVNDTLTNNFQWTKDDQVKDKKKLDILEDKVQNVSTKVFSLDSECAKMTVQDSLKATVDKLTVDLESAKRDNNELQSKLKILEGSSSAMEASINELRNYKSNVATQNTVTIQPILNHEGENVPGEKANKEPKPTSSSGSESAVKEETIEG